MLMIKLYFLVFYRVYREFWQACQGQVSSYWSTSPPGMCTSLCLDSIRVTFKKKQLGIDGNNQCLLIYAESEREKQTFVCFRLCALLADAEGSLCSHWEARWTLIYTRISAHTHGRDLPCLARWMTHLSLSIKTIYETHGLTRRVTWPVKWVIDDSAMGQSFARWLKLQRKTSERNEQPLLFKSGLAGC